MLWDPSHRLRAQTDKLSAQFMVKQDKPMDRQRMKCKKMQEKNSMAVHWGEGKGADEQGMSWMVLPPPEMVSPVHYSKE